MNRTERTIIKNSIVELHQSGTSRKEIAKQFGLTTERVRQILVKSGCDTSNQKDRTYESVVYKFLAVVGDRIKEDHVLGKINREYFFQWMRHNKGVVVHEIYRAQRLNRILELHMQDKSAAEIAAEIGCSSMLVLNELHKANIYTRSNSDFVKERNEHIKELHFKMKIGRQELAEMFNTSYANIGLILTDKHYVKYDPQYHSDKGQRRERTKQRLEELARKEKLILEMFKQNKSRSEMLTELGDEKQNTYHTQLCYRVLKKHNLI